VDLPLSANSFLERRQGLAHLTLDFLKEKCRRRTGLQGPDGAVPIYKELVDLRRVELLAPATCRGRCSALPAPLNYIEN